MNSKGDMMIENLHETFEILKILNKQKGNALLSRADIAEFTNTLNDVASTDKKIESLIRALGSENKEDVVIANLINLRLNCMNYLDYINQLDDLMRKVLKYYNDSLDLDEKNNC